MVPACYREPMSNFADIACPASPQLESATTASPDGRPKDSATFAGSRSRKTPDVPEGEMHGHGSGGPKDVWTHNVEATASLLIAFGTLITTCSAQGLFTPSTASRWILEYLVPFQLPIFYFCLGFLYQRYRTTRTPRAWGQNLRRELALMGIPFAAFTVLVLLTNSAVGAKPPLSVADLLRALFIEPVIPVGYFYTCLIIYAITPTVKSRRNASGLLFAAVAAKAAIVALASLPATAEMATRLPYAVTSVAENWIWVAGGMAMALYRGLPLVRGSEKAWALGALWVATSVIAFYAGWTGETSHAVLDALGVLWATSLFSTVFRSGRQNPLLRLRDPLHHGHLALPRHLPRPVLPSLEGGRHLRHSSTVDGGRGGGARLLRHAGADHGRPFAPWEGRHHRVSGPLSAARARPPCSGRRRTNVY